MVGLFSSSDDKKDGKEEKDDTDYFRLGMTAGKKEGREEKEEKQKDKDDKKSSW